MKSVENAIQSRKCYEMCLILVITFQAVFHEVSIGNADFYKVETFQQAVTVTFQLTVLDISSNLIKTIYSLKL